MNKQLLRIIALLLIPCLVADPILASVSRESFAARPLVQNLTLQAVYNRQTIPTLRGYYQRQADTRSLSSRINRWTSAQRPSRWVATGTLAGIFTFIASATEAATRHRHLIKPLRHAVKTLDPSVSSVAQGTLEVIKGDGLWRIGSRLGLKGSDLMSWMKRCRLRQQPPAHPVRCVWPPDSSDHDEADQSLESPRCLSSHSIAPNWSLMPADPTSIAPNVVEPYMWVVLVGIALAAGVLSYFHIRSISQRAARNYAAQTGMAPRQPIPVVVATPPTPEPPIAPLLLVTPDPVIAQSPTPERRLPHHGGQSCWQTKTIFRFPLCVHKPANRPPMNPPA
jgi:hypothetical protein